MKLKSKVKWLEVRFFIGKNKSFVIKTELKCCIMTKSLWNKYDISRKTPEVPLKRSPKVVRKERTLERTVGFDGDGRKNIRVDRRSVYFATLQLAARSAAAPAD